jgi:ankyrin repeat protein
MHFQNGWTALHFAARDAASAQVSQLIRKGAEVDKRCAKVSESAPMHPRKSRRR